MSGGSPFRVLLIGETEASRGHIDRLLQDARGPEGNSVEECHTLIQAFDFLQRTDYDVIVIEEQVARRSGCNTLRELRRARNLVPIVFLTGEETPNSPNGPGVSTESTHGSGINGFCLLRKIQCAVCLRRQEAECRKTEDKLRKLSRAVEQSADLVVITSVDGTIEYVNPAFEALTGYTPQEIIGQNPRLLKSGVQGPGYYKEMWETILAGKVFRGVLANKKKNGEIFSAEKTITPVRDVTGDITHFISNDRDITERRRLEAQLFASNQDGCHWTTGRGGARFQ